jgi:prepilin-type N-terminal cleavage/methylation domain-containing protein/prepilin-type processing-associated H-X9-DG protein
MVNRRDSAGFTLIELLVVVAIIALLVSILLPSLGKAREQAKKAYCANNLGQFGRAVHVYVGEYKYFPPHAPYPQYVSARLLHNLNTGGWDPNIGWLLTYGMRMTPPATDNTNGHFLWFMAEEEDLPEIVICPSARWDKLFIWNDDWDQGNPIESLVFKYAAFYCSPGTCRSATYLRTEKTFNRAGEGGRNPPIPDPTSPLASKPYDNSQWGNPQGYFTRHKAGAAMDDPSEGAQEITCYIQACDPSEVDNPGRVYWMADGREYRPFNKEVYGNGGYPPAVKYNGFYVGNGNKVFLGARHFGLANVNYLDGHVNTDNQMHDAMWNMSYNPTDRTIHGDQWRVSSFADQIWHASIKQQHHFMPQLNVRTWEWFFVSTNQK